METQDQFTSILSVSVQTLEDLFTIIEASDLPANLFVKHLVILADFGGEMLKRVSNEFINLFPDGKLNYYWKEQQITYKFKTFDPLSQKQKPKFSNEKLKICSEDLIKRNDNNQQQKLFANLDDLQKDAIALILFGSTYYSSSEDEQETASTLARCEIGSYLGKPDELTNFIKQRYIYVSRITGGAKSNTLGQIAQKFVAEYIKKEIGLNNIDVKMGGRLPNVSHTDETTGRSTSFDIIVTNQIKYVAIEVSFQVTTNSVIERKGGQAKSRYEQVESAGHKIAYVIDGAGNFERRTAVETICSYSHCTVAFSKAELNILCEFIKDFF